MSLRRVHSDQRGIVLGWIVRIILGIALAGVLLYEAGAVVITSVNADNAARSAAQEAVTTYAHSHNLDEAKKDAQKQAAEEGAVVVAFQADSNGLGGQSHVTVTVRKIAKTLFIQRIGFLKRFTISNATSTAYSV
jgi:hypothetical protein